MESATNQSTEQRGVLTNCRTVELGDETSRLITETLGSNVLYDRMENQRKHIYGICVMVVLATAILGFLVGLLLVKQYQSTSEAMYLKKDMDFLKIRVNQSEGLLAVVCKAEFGQTATVCNNTHFEHV